VATAAAAQLVNENLLVAVPDGYKIDYGDKKNTMIINEMVPVTESIKNWSEMVTVQIFLGMKDVTPEEFKGRMEGLWRSACPQAESHPVASGDENGYAAAVWLMSCPLNPTTGKPEMTWFKAIQGKDSFYLVQKAFKFAPSKEQVVEWTGYLKQVSVCDSRLPERPCPAVKQ
jgi:hypothetical protein